ncbi:MULTISPECIES: hypothetical protein [unclassified Rhizobium]|uniref:hypothetical protein n=1 Tax=unclassified Rhizobium TaxID=2613769 RepID=UPI000DB3C0EE|nr:MULTISPECIES: hypothetical protein [unclassified Rhizobium]MBO9172185.1 hypothetical protein [Rhizobium sp. L245/93]QXZ93593.1 hypothetical protein J5280_28030 [Rhizobium sp. K15/93]QYA05087.1 hypothetical protein J5278_27995 [Rhizobium sp. B21/90]
MAYGVSVKSCNATAVEIRKLWEEASIFEPSASMHADSALKPAAIPIIDRPPFRFEAGHHSNQ